MSIETWKLHRVEALAKLNAARLDLYELRLRALEAGVPVVDKDRAVAENAVDLARYEYQVASREW